MELLLTLPPLPQVGGVPAQPQLQLASLRPDLSSPEREDGKEILRLVEVGVLLTSPAVTLHPQHYRSEDGGEWEKKYKREH